MRFLFNIAWFLLLFLYVINTARGQHAADTIIKNRVYKASVKTVELYRQGWKLSYPVMDLNDANHLLLHFDDLTDEVENYQYTLIHCTADWKPSDLVREDYIEGFTTGEINDYEYSFNTLNSYIHYKLRLPNNDMRPLYSGNYALLVYQGYDQKNVVLTKRFSLYERRVSIDAEMKRATLAKYSEEGQELDFQVDYGSYRINDPYDELKVVVRQNNRWDRAVVGLMPKFVHGNKLVYDFDEENVFEGGNEFRFFGIQSTRYKSQRIKDIVFAEPYYHIELRNDASRKRRGYSFHEDINGKYYIDVQESERDNLQADYVLVHFSLVTDYPLPGKEVFIGGELANWEYGEHNKMEFNPEKGAYERILMLKQGYYNYEYVVRTKSSGVMDNTYFEGSYYQTENDYLIFIYHRSPSGRYDKLVGYQKINSLKRM